MNQAVDWKFLSEQLNHILKFNQTEFDGGVMCCQRMKDAIPTAAEGTDEPPAAGDLNFLRTYKGWSTYQFLCF